VNANTSNQPLVDNSTPVNRLPDAMVMNHNGLFFDDKKATVDTFGITLWPGTILRFTRLPASVNPTCFSATEVLCANSQGPHPLVLARGVLWTRQAAIEADRQIAAYIRGEGWPPQCVTESAP